MVVDDQMIVRTGLAAIVDAEPDLNVVGQAADGAAAIALADEVRTDVVVMDVRMPGMDGLTATRLITASPHRVRVLVLTTFDLDQYVFEAMRNGASGFLLKDARPHELVEAIRVVDCGEGMLAPTVTRRLIEAFASGTVAAITPDDRAVLDALTPREADVLTLVASGMSNLEIGRALGVTAGTVKIHVSAVLGKLRVRDRVQATILAYDLGLARPRRDRRS